MPGQAGVGISLGGTQLEASPSVGTGRYSRVPGADATSPADDTLGWAGRHGQAWVPIAAVCPLDTDPVILTQRS